MKYITLITILLISYSGMSQTPYQKGMQKALDLWEVNKPWEAVNMFERIATAESKEWLPLYYASMITVIESFGEKDEAQLKAQLAQLTTATISPCCIHYSSRSTAYALSKNKKTNEYAYPLEKKMAK